MPESEGQPNVTITFAIPKSSIPGVKLVEIVAVNRGSAQQQYEWFLDKWHNQFPALEDASLTGLRSAISEDAGDHGIILTWEDGNDDDKN